MAKIEVRFTNKGPGQNSEMRGGIVFDCIMMIDPRFRHDSRAKDMAEIQIQAFIERAIFDWAVENAPGEMRSWYDRQRREEYGQTGR